MTVSFMTGYWITVFVAFWVGVGAISATAYYWFEIKRKPVRVLLASTVIVYAVLWLAALLVGVWLPVSVPGLY